MRADSLIATTFTERVGLQRTKELARELETGRNRLANIPQAYTRESRKAFTGHKTIPVFRAIALHKHQPEVREESGVVSTTTRPEVALKIATDFPAMMTRDEFITPTAKILRYDVPVERIHAHVPTLIDAARRSHGDEALKKMGVETRRAGRMRVGDIFDETRREHEVLADVTGLKPEVLDFHGATQHSDREMLHAARDHITGYSGSETAKSHIATLRKQSTGITIYGDEDLAHREMEDHFARTRHFFRGHLHG